MRKVALLLLSLLGLPACGYTCVDVDDNAAISRVGWDGSNGRALVAIDRTLSHCGDEPSRARDLLEIDLPGGTWRLTQSVARGDSLPPYELPSGATDLFEGRFHSSCLGCELVLPVDSGASVVHFTVVKDGESPMALAVSVQSARVLNCAIGHATSCLAAR